MEDVGIVDFSRFNSAIGSDRRLELYPWLVADKGYRFKFILLRHIGRSEVIIVSVTSCSKIAVEIVISSRFYTL